MFQCQSIWILLVYQILKGKREEEKWAGVIKRDGEFEKSLDKMFKKVQEAHLMRRDSWRDTNRHGKGNRRWDNKETGKDKSIVRSNRKREKGKPETEHKTGKGQLNSVGPLMLGAVDRHGEGWRQQHPCIIWRFQPGPSPLCAPVRQSKRTVPEEGLLDGSKLV